MKRLLLIVGLLVLAGCAEVVQGPRVVHYNADWFAVRHATLIDSSGSIDTLAANLCAKSGRPAEFVGSTQYYAFDLRDAFYRCPHPLPVVAPVAAGPEGPVSGPGNDQLTSPPPAAIPSTPNAS